MEQKINDLIRTFRSLEKNKLGVLFRIIIEPNSSTLYKEGYHGKGMLRQGIREADYKFCKTDPFWVEASDYHGLSFSSTFSQTKFTLDLLGKFQKKKPKLIQLIGY